jgi:phenylalanyl-tRNA synthetase alpha chain
MQNLKTLLDFQKAVLMIIDKNMQTIDLANDLKSLEDIRVNAFGKKGELTALLKEVSALEATDRPAVGQLVNDAKQSVFEKLNSKIARLNAAQEEAQLAKTAVDVTMPARETSLVGSEHPVTKVRNRVETIFKLLGFSVEEGPEIEDDYHNFSALNIPASHPARAMQDTFYFKDGHLLRTHTSPVQVHVMAKQKPPLRIIAPGKVFRRDSDHTHTPMFHQVEGLVIDEHCTFSDLKGLLTDFVAAFFGESIALRFRPSYFPFTEPSAEVDIACTHCKGQSCRVCGYTGWLEVMGCGMVHPNVLHEANLDSENIQGFAFGMGLDRLAMLYYNIPDLRALFENRIELLEQFRGM